MVLLKQGMIEKALRNLREKLNLCRTLVSLEKSLDNKLFAEFVALIRLSYMKKQMQMKNLDRYYTITGLLDKLGVIARLKHPCRKLRVGEIPEKQRQLYIDLEIPPPVPP